METDKPSSTTPGQANDRDNKAFKVRLSKLDQTALKRYRRHFKLLDTPTNATKEQLIHAVEKHFNSHQVDESRVIAVFMTIVRNSGVRL